jgi:hypothetical protein
MRAVYKDEHGATYSCPVVKNDGAWAMVTSAGPTPITFFFDDNVAGRLVFDSYRDEPQAEDHRLHISRLPGESSFGALRRAYAEQKVAEERKQRQAARTEIQNVPVDPVAVANARAANNYAAEVKRPHRDAFIPAMTATEIEAALRNKRFRD